MPSDLVNQTRQMPMPTSTRPSFAVGRPILTFSCDSGRVHLSTEHITWFHEDADGISLTVHFAGGNSMTMKFTDLELSRDAVVRTLMMVLRGENPIHGALK